MKETLKKKRPKGRVCEDDCDVAMIDMIRWWWEVVSLAG
jgi:hypothetical protein